MARLDKPLNAGCDKMAYKNTYVIGDVQGCYTELQQLLALIQFDPKADQLWFVGDLVNRGPQSLAVLRFVHRLADHAITVLGNHELYLLAIAAGVVFPKAEDTLTAVLQAPDRELLFSWLVHCPLLHHDPKLGYTLVHAGIPPQWNRQEAQAYARESEGAIRANQKAFWQQYYGNKVCAWSAHLTHIERVHYALNALTRIRFCTADGQLNLTLKTKVAQDNRLKPWFKYWQRRTANDNIIFGHWSALRGHVDVPQVFALDTGCVWGQHLTAMRLPDQRLFSVPAQRSH